MAAINVRQLGNDVVKRLKQRASLKNRSLEGEIHHILECVTNDHMEAKRITFLDASDRLREKTRGRRQTSAELLVRKDRNCGHRDGF